MPNNPEKFKLNVIDAVTYTTEWRTAHANNAGMPMAFTVRYAEMSDVIGELIRVTGFPAPDLAFRFYLGYKQLQVQVAGNIMTQTKPCMAIVPVQEFEVDDNGVVTNFGTELIDLDLATVDGPIKVSGIFDFTYPCPTTCQVDSPLMTGELPVSEAAPSAL